MKGTSLNVLYALGNSRLLVLIGGLDSLKLYIGLCTIPLTNIWLELHDGHIDSMIVLLYQSRRCIHVYIVFCNYRKELFGQWIWKEYFFILILFQQGPCYDSYKEFICLDGKAYPLEWKVKGYKIINNISWENRPTNTLHKSGVCPHTKTNEIARSKTKVE